MKATPIHRRKTLFKCLFAALPVGALGLLGLVAQTATAQCTYELSLTETNLSAAESGGAFTVNTTAECVWTAITTNDWIHATASTNAGPGDVAFLVDTNASIVARVGYIQVANQTFTVSQAAAPCAFALSLAETNISAAALSAGFSVAAAFAECPWTASTTNDWIHATASTNAGPGDVTFLVDTNASTVARVGYIQVADQTFTVSQAAAPCAFTLSLTATNVSAAEMQGGFSVTTSFPECSWTPSSTNEWIHATASTNAGPGDVTFVVDTNASIVARVGYIQVADQTVTVSQAAAPCTFALTFNERATAAAATEGTVGVIASFPDCTWTATTSNDWIHVTLGAEPGKFSYLVDTNASTAARVGYIQVADQTFTVSQAAAPCTYTLSLAVASLSAAAGQGSFSVVASFPDCAWTASTTSDWIHTTSAATGSGDVTYLVDTNASPVARVGTIQVANQTFTITQAGAACTFSLSATGTNIDSAPMSGSFGVSSSFAECTWTASTTNAWVHITPNASAVSYSVETNATDLVRTGVILVQGQAFVIVQAAAPVPAVAGAYSGLFYETDGTNMVVNHKASGFFTLQVARKNAFTGRLYTGSGSYPFRGQFANGEASLTVKRPASQGEPLSMTLKYAKAGSDTLIGEVKTTGWTAELLGHRAEFTKASPATAGKYTLQFTAPDTGACPDGTTVGAVSVTPSGMVKFTGRLSDGTPVTQSVTVGLQGDWPLYASLYNRKGALLGWSKIAPAEGVSGELGWSKPASSARSAVYPLGFTNSFGVTGLAYAQPARGQGALNFTNGYVVLSGASIFAKPTTNEVVITGNKIVSTAGDMHLKLEVAPATGLFTGTIRFSDASENLKVTGAVFQGSVNQAQGYFLDGQESGSILLYKK
jgi:hypothetical protein